MYLLVAGMFLILVACGGSCADGCAKACCAAEEILGPDDADLGCADDCVKACCKGCHATEGDKVCLADHSCCAHHNEADPEEDTE